jgi:hypothetical protein
VRKSDPQDPTYEGDLPDWPVRWPVRQEIIAALRNVTGVQEKTGGLNVGGWSSEIDYLLEHIDDPLLERRMIKKNTAFKDAEAKIRAAKVAFDKLSSDQRKAIRYSIKKNYYSIEPFAETAPPDPEIVISDIVAAFARLTGKNPHPVAYGKGVMRDYEFRRFVLRLRELVEENGGSLYPNPDSSDGGRKFKAVLDILRPYYPQFIPKKLPLKSIDEDWRRRKKTPPGHSNY